MAVAHDVQEFADAQVKSVLIKLQRLFQMMLTQTEDRDSATLSQRTGTPMPPELIGLWTDALWASSCPTMPQEAKDETIRFIDAKFKPRLGLYALGMVPIEDLMRQYLAPSEVEVLMRKMPKKGVKDVDEPESANSASEIKAAIAALQERLEEVEESAE